MLFVFIWFPFETKNTQYRILYIDLCTGRSCDFENCIVQTSLLFHTNCHSHAIYVALLNINVHFKPFFSVLNSPLILADNTVVINKLVGKNFLLDTVYIPCKTPTYHTATFLTIQIRIIKRNDYERLPFWCIGIFLRLLANWFFPTDCTGWSTTPWLWSL